MRQEGVWRGGGGVLLHTSSVHGRRIHLHFISAWSYKYACAVNNGILLLSSLAKKKKQAPPRRLSLVVLEIMPPTCPFNRVLPEIREAAALRGLSGKRYRGKDEGEGLHAAFHF